MKNKKAQMKIQQMIVVLIAVTIFFVIVGMFVLVWSLSGLKKTAELLEEKNAMLLAVKLSNSPEFSCGNSFGTGKVNCIDTDKVMALKKFSEKYNGFWGKDATNIEIRKIYPAEKEKECTSATYPECNYIKLYEKEISGNYIWNFVSLCRRLDERNTKCELGKLFIGYKSK